MKAFLKSPIDGMMCLRQKNGKVRIFKNTRVFAVRSNIGVAKDSRRLSRESMNFELGLWKPSQSPSEPPWGLDLEAFWPPKTVQFRLEHHVN